MTVKAVALYSGGLDSILAREAAARQGVEVVCVWMSTCFQKPYIDVVKLGKGLSRLESDLSSRFKTCVAVLSVCEEFFHIMQDPAHGFGKNVNPCIDCKIAMMKRAKSYMNKIGASFIISGEVLGQRPMSQNREALKLIEREAGVEGLVLRPLCAQHLDETVPEQKGWVDRKKLYGDRKSVV